MIGRRDYETRRAARIERLEARAAKARAEGSSRLGRADAISRMIPLGQPILVGHHSERRHRRDIKRIHDGLTSGFASLKKADELDRRAVSAEENRAISSDDPDAIERLKEKLIEEERQHAVTLKANKLLRAGKPLAEVAPLFDWWKDPLRRLEIWLSMGSRTISTTNASAEIRRIKGRIAVLEAKAAKPPLEPETIGPVTLDEEDNRVRLTFPGKPSDTIRAALKGAGFRWAPTVGAWVRMSSNAALYHARQVAQLAAREAGHGGEN